MGSEYLVNQLHDIDPKFEGIQSKEVLYTPVPQDDKLGGNVLLILSNLGKRNYTDSSSFFSFQRPTINCLVSSLGKTILIIGSNASGKSTYIKAITINAILTQQN